MKLHSKVVFITDADSDSGKAILNRLSVEGTHFILNSISQGESIEAELKNAHAAGSKTYVRSIQLVSGQDVTNALHEAEQLLGGTCDLLIHNNDLLMPAMIETCTEDDFLEMINANAKTAFVCTQAVGKQMVAKHSGKIIYVSSIHAEKPTGFSFAYSASKGAIKLLAKEAALELGRNGVGVTTIEVGAIRGDHERFPSEITFLYEDYERKIPSDLPVSYDDLAHLVMYLSSDEVHFMNGSDIRLDGGFLLHYMDHKKKQLNEAR